MRYIKKITFVSGILLSVGALIFLLFPDLTVAQNLRDSLGMNSNAKITRKSTQLFNQIKSYSDSVNMLKYSYSMSYEYDDSSNEVYNGVYYKKRNFNIDSNAVQFTYNNNKDYFSINHKTQMATYAFIDKIKEEVKKSSTKQMEDDSLNLQVKNYNLMDIGDSIINYLIETDRSFETDSKIVIDVDFNEDAVITHYFLSFDKQSQIPDSMMVQFVQVYEYDVPESEFNNSEEADYYRDFTATECVITFKAFDFAKGFFDVEKRLNSYVKVSGDNVKLIKNKNYNLTILK